MKVWSAITHIANTSSAIPANVSGLPAKASEVPATHKVLTVQGKESKVEGMNAWSPEACCTVLGQKFSGHFAMA